MPGTRRDTRLPFRADLDVIVAGRPRWARGRDISTHGACFSCECRVACGDAIQLDLSSVGLGIRGAIVRHVRVHRERFIVGVELFGALTTDEVTLLTKGGSEQLRD